MRHHRGPLELRQQFHRRGLQALQRLLGRGLVVPGMLQRATHQNMPVAPRDRIAPLGQHHARQEVFGTFEQNHLALHRLHRQLQAERTQQVATPGAGTEHHLIRRQHAVCRLHPGHAAALLDKTGNLAVLTQGHVGQRQQRRLERLHQARVAHVGHAGHVDGTLEARAQHRHRVIGRRDIHGTQRPLLTLGPGQRFGLVVQVEPVQAGGVHFGVDAGAGEQTLAQLWIKVLRPVCQGGHGRAVAPRVQRRDDATAGPGRLTADFTLITHHHLPDLRRQVECRQQADHPAADHHYLLAHLSIQHLK
ncbi:hypothetical protein D3C79_749520 [compost metagenome]